VHAVHQMSALNSYTIEVENVVKYIFKKLFNYFRVPGILPDCSWKHGIFLSPEVMRLVWSYLADTRGVQR